MTSLSVNAIEELFINKLSEKYELNARGIKKAFSKFDNDNSGLLDLNELKAAFSLFLNGVKESDIKALVQKYDTNGDGKISYEELLAMLTKKRSKVTSSSSIKVNNSNSKEINDNYKYNSPSKDRNKTRPTRDEIKVKLGINNNNNNNNNISLNSLNINDDISEGSSINLYSSPKPNQRNTKRGGSRPVKSAWESEPESYSEIASNIDIGNTKDLENRAKTILQNIRSILMKKASDIRLHGKIANRLTMTTSQLMDDVGRKLLIKAFSPYSNEMDEGKSVDPRRIGIKKVLSVSISDFCKVIRSFVALGGQPARPEVSVFLFELCQMNNNNYEDPVANVLELVNLVFGTKDDKLPISMEKIRQHPDKAMEITENIEKNQKLSLADRIDQGRKDIGRGPIKAPVDPYLNHQIAAIDEVPLRFLSRKSRTSLTAPSNFDTSLLMRSSKLPEFEIVREHAYGMSCSIASGNIVNSLANTGRNNSGRKDTIVYASAALGIVHDLSTNKQDFFDFHADDVTCISISFDGTLSATGCTGKEPLIYIWSTDNHDLARKTPPLYTIGKGFFKRFVAAVSFSGDGRLLSGIGSDDFGMMGIWSLTDSASNGDLNPVPTAELLYEVSCCHGLPGQIKDMIWSKTQQYTEYITGEHSGLCDLIATAGDHHIKIWSFRRPSVSPLGGAAVGASLLSKAALMGKSSGKAAKIYTCCAFLPNVDKTNDLIAGGSNGVVYLWKQGQCVTFSQCIRGGVKCLSIVGDKLICGGTSGGIKLLDARSLATVFSYTLEGTIETSMKARPSSASRSTGGNVANERQAQDIIGVYGLINNKKGDLSVFVTTVGNGLNKIDISQSSFSSSGGNGQPNKINTVFNYHYGKVYGLASESSRGGRLIATCGDDRKLCVWDSIDKGIIAQNITTAHGKCCHFDRTSNFIAVGQAGGIISVYALGGNSNSKSSGSCRGGSSKATDNLRSLVEVTFRRDSKEDISDIKFSPNDEYLASGSHDNIICVYNCRFNENSCIIRPLHKLRGHTSFVTHLDWSLDSKIIQSTCASYELLYWDVQNGGLYKPGYESKNDTADFVWKSHTCVLGFNVMGIWHPYSDGTDINAIGNLFVLLVIFY
jgi:WD40 repeat protein